MVAITKLPQLVLLLYTDQFRYDAFHPKITPNLYNELALSSNTTTFTNAYVSTPICTPSRAGLLTGKSPWAHGMLGYGYTVNCTKYPTTLPMIMKEVLNYTTRSAGKCHFGWNGTGSYCSHGYDKLSVYDALDNQPYPDEYMKFFNSSHPNVDPLSVTCNYLDYNDWKACPYGLKDESQHPTPWTTQQAIDYLNEFTNDNNDENDKDNKNNNKLFLKVSYHRPHSPYDPPSRIFNQYLKGGDKHHLVSKRFINNTSWDKAFVNTSEMQHDAWHGDPGEMAALRSRAGYLASCEFVDEEFGKLVRYLKQHKLWETSMIIWTTDHGDMNGDHNLWRKGYPWEQNLHVNLIMKLPSSNTNRIENNRLVSTTTNTKKDQVIASDALVEARDVAVTMYDYLGVLSHVKKRDPLMDGRSLLPILLHPGESNRKVRDWLDLELSRTYRDDVHWNAIIGSYNNNNNNNNKDDDDIVCQQWKYIFNVWKGNEQLFCLSNDPNETYDLANVTKYHSVLIHWRQTMVKQFTDEKRDERFIKGGKLVSGRGSIIYASNFPCGTDFPNSNDEINNDIDLVATI